MAKESRNKLVGRTVRIFFFIYKGGFSPLFGPCCRFTPTCSRYALLSIERFGLLIGAWFALKRIVKCHPFHPGGYDPVPEYFPNP